MSTENLERISNGHGSTARTGGELEVPWTARASAVQDLNGADGSAVYNPSPVVVSPTELCTADAAYPLELSGGDAVTDRYREMEKRIEEQDRTIAEMKRVIENLQDIVYRQKLDKEAETLVL